MRGPQSGYVATIVAASMRACEEKSGLDPVVLDPRGVVDTFDALVVVSGSQRPPGARHRRGGRAPGAAARVRPTHVKGLAEGEWVALDYGDVIVHVFDEIDREYYDLEHLWSVPASRPARATQGLSSEA